MVLGSTKSRKQNVLYLLLIANIRIKQKLFSNRKRRFVTLNFYEYFLSPSTKLVILYLIVWYLAVQELDVKIYP